PAARYLPHARTVARAFADPSGATADAVARHYGIAAWVVTDLDPVWNNPRSWVWTRRPALALPHVRVLLTQAAGQGP
ncbi:MAG TPA: hypothetical protein VD962_08555, partial [Rubricoccaceae bacterium]|nr:hypothetical protein [Rubricoccaceae bacterium]